MFAPLPNFGSSVPSLLHNADALYDSSTSCWNRLIRMKAMLALSFLRVVGHYAKWLKKWPQTRLAGEGN
ncbi:hypothetical protein Tco_0016213 [Tanacetum coccineum]